MSRNVDAVIDSMSQKSIILEEPEVELGGDPVGQCNQDLNGCLPRARRLSDSSIHSSRREGPVNRLVTPAGLALSSPTHHAVTAETQTFGAYDRRSVMHALTRKVQNLASNYSGSLGSIRVNGSGAGVKAVPADISAADASPPRPIPQKGTLRRVSSNVHRKPLTSTIGGGTPSSSPIRIPGLSALVPGLSVMGLSPDHMEGGPESFAGKDTREADWSWLESNRECE